MGCVSVCVCVCGWYIAAKRLNGLAWSSVWRLPERSTKQSARTSTPCTDCKSAQ